MYLVRCGFESCEKHYSRVVQQQDARLFIDEMRVRILPLELDNTTTKDYGGAVLVIFVLTLILYAVASDNEEVAK